MIIVTSSFSKSSVFKMFSVHAKTQTGVLKFLRFEERFRDGLVGTVGLTGEIKLRFQIGKEKTTKVKTLFDVHVCFRGVHQS